MTMIINETTEENRVKYLCTTSKNEPEALIWGQWVVSQLGIHHMWPAYSLGIEQFTCFSTTIWDT